MLKVSYASCPGLSLVIVVQFAVEMCVAAKNHKFCPPLSFSALVQGDPLRIYGKALRFLKLVFQAAEGEDLVILACTVFD